MTDKVAQGTTESPASRYQGAFGDSLALRAEFARKPGYVREKSPDEQAFHAAKSAFGEFHPDNKAGMAANTNGGKGVDVTVSDDAVVHVDNQLTLYQKIVGFNQARGGFYDVAAIEAVSPEDAARLKQVNDTLSGARRAVLKAAGTAAGHAQLRRLETDVQSAPPASATSPAAPASATGSTADTAASDNAIERSGEPETDAPTTPKRRMDVLERYYFYVGEPGKGQYFHRGRPHDWVIQDQGNRLKTQHASSQVAEVLVEIAEERGWTTIKVSGDKEFRQQVWLAASREGIKVKGYTPTHADREALNPRTTEHTPSTTTDPTPLPPSPTPPARDGAAPDSESSPAVTAPNQTSTAAGSATQAPARNGSAETVERDAAHPAAGTETGELAGPEDARYERETRVYTPSAEADAAFEQDVAAASELRAARQTRVRAREGHASPNTKRLAALRDAVVNLDKKTALDTYPELASVYSFEEATHAYLDAQPRQVSNQSRDRLVHSIRERTLTALSRGDQLPRESRALEAITALTTQASPGAGVDI